MSGSERPPPPKAPAGKNWGGVARRGAAVVKRPDDPIDGEGDGSYTAEEKAAYAARQAKRDVKAARHRELQDEAAEAISRAGAKPPKRKRSKGPKERAPLPGRPHQRADPSKTFIRLLGEKPGKRAARDLNIAAKAFDAERYRDSLKLVKPLVQVAPEVPEVRELHGLTLYRLEKWGPAITELEDFRVLTGSTEQHPVLADCYRAQERWADVDELWTELREASPSGELVTEGRIVAAGSLADQGDTAGAIRLLQKGWKRPKKAREHHLRRAYALADLHERAGELPLARDLFAWIKRQAPDYLDVNDRLASLS